MLKKYWFLKAFLNGQRGDEYSREVLHPSGRSGFGVILASLWRHFGVFGIILGVRGLLWSHFGPFPKYTHMYIQRYAYVDTFSDHFHITLGSLWGHFGVTLGTLWVSFWGHFEITLG